MNHNGPTDSPVEDGPSAVGRTVGALPSDDGLLEHFVKHAALLAWMKDEEGRLVFINEGMKAFIPRPDWKGKTDHELWPAEWATRYRASDQAILDGQPAPITEEKYEDGSARVTWWLTHKWLFTDATGRRFVGGVAVNITDKKIAEQALQDTREYLGMAQRSARVGLWDWNLKTGAMTWSLEMHDLFGFAATEPQNLFEAWKRVVHPEDLPRVLERMQKIMQQHSPIPITDYYRILRASGEIRWIHIVGNTTHDQAGCPMRLSGICLDVTEGKLADLERAEQQRQMEILSTRLASAHEDERRRIAAGLHDDVGQLLAAAIMKLGMLGKREEPGAQALLSEARSLLASAVDELRELSFELRSPTLYEVGFEAAMDELCSHMSAKFGNRFVYEGNEPPVAVPLPMRGNLYLAVRELLLNAAKHAEATTVVVRTTLQASTLRLVVEDNGKGFSVGAGQQIRRVGGIGLHHVRQRLGDMAGQLSIWSRPGEGTKAVITVPLHADQEEASGA